MVQSARALRCLTSPGEIGWATADFSPMLPADVTIQAVVVTMSVSPQNGYPGFDADASARLLRGPFIVASPSDGTPSRAASYKVGNFLPGVCYAIQFAGTGSDGSNPVLWQYWVADYPGMPGGLPFQP